jgi:hypothetical protein
MKIDWNDNVVTVETKLNLHELCNMILALHIGEQSELIREVLCNWDQTEIDDLLEWLAE